MSARIAVLVACLLPALAAGAPAAAETVVTEGVVRSEARVEIKSRGVQPVRRIAVREGQRVAEGDVLVEQVNDVERAQLAAAEADLARARAMLTAAELRAETARRENERTRKVEDLVTEKELEMSRDTVRQAESTLDVARREVDSALANVELARTVFENTIVRAPFAGVVSRIPAIVGMMPKPTETTLVDLIALDRLYVEVAVPLAHLGAVREGTPARIEVEPDTIADPPSLGGRVSFVYPEIDPQTRMFRVKIPLAKAPATVRPGMFARVSLDVS